MVEGIDYERIIADIHRNYSQKIEVLEAMLQVYKQVFQKAIEESKEAKGELQAYHGVG